MSTILNTKADGGAQHPLRLEECFCHKERATMPTAAEMNALVGAFGSIIGYLGAEAADTSTFETLLWPHRCYNQNNALGCLTSALTMPLGGPLHKAALKVLDSFRIRGLYLGQSLGHMLGTAFFPDNKLRYEIYSEDDMDDDRDVRNCLWVNVLHRLRDYQPRTVVQVKVDVEKQREKQRLVRRTTQRIQHFHLSWADPADKTDQALVTFREDRIPLIAPLSMLASETTALISAGLVAYLDSCYWFSAYLCLPLMLKLLSIPASVRREGLSERPPNHASEKSILVEISDYDHGFPLIEGPESVIRQFFRHYAHPVRYTWGDRMRELASITLVLGLVLNFPLGLLSMLFVPVNVQIVWISYQLYVVLIMHWNRVRGSEEPGRMDKAMAKALVQGKTVRLASGDSAVNATLTSEEVSSIGEGKKRVKDLAARYQKQVPDLIRLSSQKSDSDEKLSQSAA